MADGEKTNEAAANGDQQNVVSRVSNLPLVSSACGAVCNAYTSTKDSVPMLKGVMDAAESGVRTLGAAAATGSKPLLNIIEPQLATVNEYAMKGLDKMEEKLPILQQPAEKVVSNTVGIVRQSVTGAKDAVVGAVMGGVEKTRAAVSGGISTVMGTSVGQMVSSGVGLALTRSEDWVEQNLPLTERELAAVAEPATYQVSSSSPSYFVRLGNLSAKVQERALQQSLLRAQQARDTARAAVAQMTSTLDLLESARTSMASGGQQIGGAIEQLQQRWTEWSQKQPGGGQAASDGSQDEAERLEWRVLSMARGLSEQLRSASANVVSSAQGLPGAVQEQLTGARRSADELQASLVDAGAITPLLLERSRHHLTQVQQSLDGVTEYLLNNTPLNWLVGPFAPMITERMAGDTQTAGQKSNAF
ncbi:mannose-6-phosphate receptor binding protein 1 isoform X1 [Phyllopteryx taeniolatus]|uniref:mannose-6-phosphate receptor binding protein 1 isoform X1 n=1 Tax=Phyllopteryx taeniolatus TaxID=161469 RepID=UPI002AD45622|nr:mannose-6-phosphate receptor binding protein 1 isoform X1 [Phyllopteryx taeniolatus]XP_061634560.1 mannose-6-phosphate receptor binding protein 1 isoform X1 [Phyllopteryx taeniolatus]